MPRRRSITTLLLLASTSAWGALAPTGCQAGGGPENVLLVVNPQSQQSMAVANHYIQVRDIPPTNVLYLGWKSGKSNILGKVFLKRFLEPIWAAIDQRGLAGQIDYVVYSADFPFRVDFKDLVGPLPPRPGSAPRLSITSATYLGKLAAQQPKAVMAANSNLYFAPSIGGLTLSRAFDSETRWGPNGRPSRKGGAQYMLSTMLGVTYRGASTVDQIKSYLSRSAEADGTRPEGTVYFATNRNVRSQVREQQIPQAIQQIGRVGVTVQKVTGAFPKSRGDIIGVTSGTTTYNIRDFRSRLRPGAIGDNLTSYGARFDNPPGAQPQTLLTHFLNNGGAGASGTVVEPTANPTKFPAATLHLHYVRGCSMAESFYQSVLSPFQLMIVGDPLCQPFAKRADLTPGELRDGDKVEGVVTITPRAESEESVEVTLFKLYLDGVLIDQAPAGKPLNFDTATVADGPHEVRLVGIDKTPMQTQSRWSGTVNVRNGHDAVQLTVEPQSGAVKNPSYTVRIASTVKESIRLMHNGRELGRVNRGQGVLSVEAAELGPGPVELYAESTAEPGVRSKPASIELP